MLNFPENFVTLASPERSALAGQGGDAPAAGGRDACSGPARRTARAPGMRDGTMADETSERKGPSDILWIGVFIAVLAFTIYALATGIKL